MQKLISIIVSAIALFAGLKQQIKDLKEQLADANTKLGDAATKAEALQEALDAENLDDAALEKAAADATAAAEQARADADALAAKVADLESADAEALAKGEELQAAINENPAVPNVDENFNVTSGATQTPTEADLAARNAENSGQA